MSEPNDDSDLELRDRLRSWLLPLLGLCWLAYLGASQLRTVPSGIDYVGVLLGVGLMVAGAIRFLRPGHDAESSDPTGDADSQKATGDADSPEATGDADSPEATGNSGAKEE